MSPSPPFPRYKGYNEVATGATTGSGHAEPKAGLVKVKSQETQPTSLPMCPAPAKNSGGPTRSTGLQGGPDYTGGTGEWLNSEAGRHYLAKHQLRLPPTQLLSLECQKRKFNPDFLIEQVDGRAYKCRVIVRDVTIRHRGHYPNAVAAKQDLALKALKVVQSWAIPPTKLYFAAQFSGQISDDAVHDNLRRVLNGRKYDLSTLRYPGMSGGFLLLQIPESQGFSTGIIRLDGALNSVVFVSIKRTDHCNVCVRTDLTSHSRVYCPLWRPSSPAPVKTQFDDRKYSFFQRPVQNEPKLYNPRRNRDSAMAQQSDGPVDKQDQLIRTIKEVMGTTPTSSESQDPRVKAAFLEGIALGARLAATTPDNATNKERQRSRSPGARHPPGSDYWRPAGYRARSPLPLVRDRQRSRELMADCGLERRQTAYGAWDPPRGRRRSPEPYVSQGASHWDHDMYFR